jgi:hypothetical protein
MDKETLKKLLKENLRVETDIYWTFEKYRIRTKILFDDTVITEDFYEMEAI